MGLRTVPDFENIYIDTPISIEIVQEDAASDPTLERPDDRTIRIDLLEEAHKIPVSVKPTDSLAVATTRMQLEGLSRLPVMESDYKVNGIVTWESIGSKQALGYECNEVRHCMEPAKETTIRKPLLDAMKDISEYGYVLVKGTDNRITGIVTASDIARKFAQIAGRFVVIGEIEGYLRILVHNKFTFAELKETGQEDGRAIAGAADLTLGNYCRLLQEPSRWEKLNLTVDRRVFNEQLDSIRNIRNDVMHFSAEDDDPEEMKALLNFARFLSELLGANTSS